MTIGEKALQAGRKAAISVWGKWITILSTGLKVQGEFEEIEPITLDTELGSDPREGCWFHFQRPAPDIAVNETLTDEDGNQWTVIQAREDHPYKPTVKYKVEKVI